MDELLMNNDIKTFFESLEEISKIDEEEIDDELIKQFDELIRTQMQGYSGRVAIKEMINNLETQGASRQEAEDAVKALKDYINTKVFGDKIYGPKQKKLIDGLLNATYELFDSAIEMYHSFSIELPMTLDEGATIPTYAHDTDAAADLYALEDTNLNAHTYGNLVHTGVHIQLPEGWLALVLPRSGMSKNTPFRVSNAPGLIDSGYRGEIGVLIDNMTESNSFIRKGTRVAQLLVMPSYRFKAKVVESLDESDRGEGGFGSTGT